jgi:hypothetical protein
MYNVNQYSSNNTFILVGSQGNSTITIPYGNYNVYSFMTQLNVLLGGIIIVSYNVATNTYTYNATQISISNSNAKLIPMYSLVYYKPNNSQYAQQGAVSASSLITRLKYNTITNNSYKYQTAYGMAMANALAYGVPEGGYTIKDKIGYPIKKTPTFSKYSDGFAKCEAKSFSNMI